MMKNEKEIFIKLGIVEDEKLFRQLLVKLFEGLNRFRIVLQAQDGREL
jgi:CheY-like chemotaxis protein